MKCERLAVHKAHKSQIKGVGGVYADPLPDPMARPRQAPGGGGGGKIGRPQSILHFLSPDLFFYEMPILQFFLLRGFGDEVRRNAGSRQADGRKGAVSRNTMSLSGGF